MQNLYGALVIRSCGVRLKFDAGTVTGVVCQLAVKQVKPIKIKTADNARLLIAVRILIIGIKAKRDVNIAYYKRRLNIIQFKNRSIAFCAVEVDIAIIDGVAVDNKKLGLLGKNEEIRQLIRGDVKLISVQVKNDCSAGFRCVRLKLDRIVKINLLFNVVRKKNPVAAVGSCNGFRQSVKGVDLKGVVKRIDTGGTRRERYGEHDRENHQDCQNR